MVWTVVLIVTLKYVIILLRADHNGEGGTFALMSLGQSVATRSGPVLTVLGVLGASFFYGDAIITPAISVLSAVEGLEVISPHFKKIVLPLTVTRLAEQLAGEYGVEVERAKVSLPALAQASTADGGPLPKV